MELPLHHRILRPILLLLALALPRDAHAQDDRATLWFHLAQEARRQGDAARAAEWLAEAVRLDPLAPLPRVEWAGALLATGDPAQAEAALEPLASWWTELPMREDGLAARYARVKAAAAARRGKPDQAAVWYERAVERAPRDLGLRAQLIGHYRARGDEEAALLHLSATAQALPGNVDLQIELGRALLALDRWEEAEAAFGRALALNPALDPAWDGLGVARTLRGDLAGAEEALRQGLRFAPSSATIYEHLGDVLLSGGRAAEALNAYERAAALAPAEPRLAEKIEHARAALSR